MQADTHNPQRNWALTLFSPARANDTRSAPTPLSRARTSFSHARNGGQSPISYNVNSLWRRYFPELGSDPHFSAHFSCTSHILPSAATGACHG